MRHLRLVSKAPTFAEDEVPIELVIELVLAILGAIVTFLEAKAGPTA